MARITKGLLTSLEGQLDGMTLYKRGENIFARPSHIRQPRRLSRKQLAIRERQSHNNALWRALKKTGMVYFDGDNTPYKIGRAHV